MKTRTRSRQQILTLIAIVLTFGSGATDVASFTRLGGVFTSVMTGNIVLWGLSVAQRSVALASHTAVSIGGYIAGVAGGTWIAHGFKATSAGADGDQQRASVLPGHVNWALFGELILLAGMTAGWEITGARPAGWVQFCLLAVTAAAMGVQASAVNEMGLAHVSTTFLTGTLTGLVSSLASPGKETPQGPRRFGVLIGLAAGASLSGLLVATAPDIVPALPLGAVLATLVLASVRAELASGTAGSLLLYPLRVAGSCRLRSLSAESSALVTMDLRCSRELSNSRRHSEVSLFRIFPRDAEVCSSRGGDRGVAAGRRAEPVPGPAYPARDGDPVGPAVGRPYAVDRRHACQPEG
jgi:uncharacterized membrane protein YoaK (UPF0700 family)